MSGRFFDNSDMVVAEDGDGQQHSPAAGGPPPPGDGPQQGPLEASPEGARRGEFVEDLPDKIKELRSAPERQMYDAHKQYASVFKRGTIQDPLIGEDSETVEQIDRFAAGIYSDMRLSAPEAQQVHDVFSTAVTDEIADQWRAESEAYLKSLGQEGPSKLELAKQLARRDPRVHELLKGPYGDNPVLLRLLVEKAAAEKRDGRL